MTSRECYVYITLPGQTDQVTAGKFVLETGINGTSVGRFVYGKSYLNRKNAVEIDPIELQLVDKNFDTTEMRGIFGALRDASPDYWGRELIDRHFAGRPDEMDYLLRSPDDRVGALGFGLNQIPPAPENRFNRMLELEKLQAYAEEIINEENTKVENEDKRQVEKLLLLGTSMGGARPKATVEAENALWVAKFNRKDDKWNVARVERAMLILAKKCGLSVADSKVVSVAGKDVLLVKRFDREKLNDGYLRYRMISALTALHSTDEASERRDWSYITLAETMRKFCSNAKSNAKELFKRMVFNAMISNNDDHPRNHAFVAKNTEWNLSPAYDLTPSTPVSQTERLLALECGRMGRIAQKSNLLSESARFLLEPAEAEKIIDEMYDIVKSEWYSVVKACGVSDADCEKIRTAFCYDGFKTDI